MREREGRNGIIGMNCGGWSRMKRMKKGNRTNRWNLPGSLALISAMVILLVILQVPVSADPYVGGMPLDTVQTGVVSGDLYVDATLPSWGQRDVAKKFSLPASAQVRWARLFVVVYCGHMQNNYNGTTTVSFDGNGDGTYETVLGTEKLDVPYTYAVDEGPGYVSVNGHTSRVTSDYVMWYDVSSRITSNKPGARVETAKLSPSSSFDGRIKAITLVVAYDDGDADKVWYAVNQGHDADTYYSDEQLGEDYRGETSFNPSDLPESVEKATLTVNHLASQDGYYRFNGEDLEGGQYQGAYYGSNTWDVTGEVKSNGENLLVYDRYGGTGTGYEGQFYKIILATLAIRQGTEPEETPEETPEPEETTLIPAGSEGGGAASGNSDTPEGISNENGYYGQTIPAVINGSVNGSVNLYTTSDYSGLILAGESKNYTLQIPLSPADQARLARLYVYTTWDHDDKRREGLAAPLALQYVGKTIPPSAHYSDRKGFGIYDYPAETFAYDIRDLVSKTGNYTFTILNTGKGDEAFAVYGVLLVLASETDGGTPTKYWIAEGSDVLLAGPEFQTTTEDSTTVFSFEGIPSAASAARLSLISTAASGIPDDENRITFNGKEWSNLLTNGSSATSIATVEVKEPLRSGRNEATIQSYLTKKRGDYMENRGAVLVVVPGGTELPTVPTPAWTVGQEPVRVTRTVTARETSAKVTSIPMPGESQGGFFEQIFKYILTPIMPSSANRTPPAVSAAVLPAEINLTIITDPEGAQVTVNGVDYEDLTPLEVSVPRGDPQEVTVTLDGYDPYRTALTPAGDYDLRIIFTPYVPRKVAASPSSSPGNGHLGGVYVESYPSEATILIDGRKTELVTPKVVYGLREGYHTVSLEKKGAVFLGKKRVYVTAGALTRVPFTESGEFARTLNISSEDYAGSSFTVNGRGPPIEMPSEVEIDDYPAFIAILRDGSYLSRNVLPQLESGQTMVVRPDPTDLQALNVVVSSEPSGSEILFDGFPTDLRTPAVVENISPGLHRVTVQAQGYLPGEEELMMFNTVTDPIDEKVFIRLEPYPYGSLNLTSSPEGAKVYLSGRNTGEKTPVVIPFLPIGIYSVKLVGEKESHGSEVVITPGNEQAVHAVFNT